MPLGKRMGDCKFKFSDGLLQNTVLLKNKCQYIGNGNCQKANLVSGKGRIIWSILSLIPKIVYTVPKENLYQKYIRHKHENMNPEIAYFRKGTQGLSAYGNTPVALVTADCVALACCLENRLWGIFYSNQEGFIKR